MTKEELELENSKLKIKVESLELELERSKDRRENHRKIATICNYIVAIIGYVFVDCYASLFDPLTRSLICFSAIFFLVLWIYFIKKEN